MSELHIIMNSAKIILDKRLYRKIKKLESADEKMLAAKYLMKSCLEHKFHELNKRKSSLEELKKDVFLIDLKLVALKNKISLFLSDVNPKDLKSLISLFNNLEQETKNV